MKILIIILLSVGVVWFASPFLPEPPTLAEVKDKVEDFFSSEYTEEDIEQYITEFNDYREENGVHRLKISATLNTMARKRAEEIKTDFSHSNKPSGCAEIIANLAGREPLDIWKGSSSHNFIMLNPKYSSTGFAMKNGLAVQLFK